MNELRRLLWRFEAGLIPREQIAARLKAESGELVGLYRRDDALWQAIAQSGTREFDLRKDFDRAIDAAGAALVAGSPRAVCTEIENAAAVLRQLQLAADAWISIEAARTTLNDLTAAVSASSLHLFATLIAVKGMINRASELFAAGDYAPARFVAQMSRRHMGDSTRKEHTSVAPGLATNLAALRELDRKFAGTWVGSPMDSSFSDALTCVQRFLDKGQSELARRLLEDLTPAAASRTAFLSELDRAATIRHLTVAQSGPEAVLAACGVGSEGTLDCVTEKLLQADLERVGGVVSSIYASCRISEVTQGSVKS